MGDQFVFPYTEDDMAYLSARDPVLGRAIAEIGRIERTVIPDAFAALANSIVGQQISTKAHQTVWARLLELTGDASPNAILHTREDALRGCGLSGRKVGYLRAAACAAQDGALDRNQLDSLSDEQVIARLTALPGVGVWTAEMLLIFALCRKNVFSTRDFGIRRGISLLYEVPTPDETLFSALYQRYSPLSSVASLYLWEISARIK